jgi:hypothetical protein
MRTDGRTEGRGGGEGARGAAVPASSDRGVTHRGRQSEDPSPALGKAPSMPARRDEGGPGSAGRGGVVGDLKRRFRLLHRQRQHQHASTAAKDNEGARTNPAEPEIATFRVEGQARGKANKNVEGSASAADRRGGGGRGEEDGQGAEVSRYGEADKAVADGEVAKDEREGGALPQGWSMRTARSTGRVFYYHRETKRTQWRRPTE